MSREESVSDFYTSVNLTRTKDAVSPSKSLVSDSESTDKIENCIVTRSENHTKEPSKILPKLIHTASHSEGKLIKSPLGSSTPVSGSEHSVGSINIIRNKQLEQLHKHLAKHVAEKQMSLDPVNLQNSLSKNSTSPSLNLHRKNIENNDNECKLSTSFINETGNSNNKSKINIQTSQQSDSDSSDEEFRQIFNNSSLSNAKKSITTTKNLSSSNQIISAILPSSDPSMIKSKSSPIEHNSFDKSNASHSSDEDNNSVYAQNVYKLLKPDNSDKEILFNINKSLNKSTTKKSSMLKLNTNCLNNAAEDLVNTKNQDENKVLKKQSNSTFLMLSDSESSSCENSKCLSVAKKDHAISFNKPIENSSVTDNSPRLKIDVSNTSSSDDEAYTKLRQNISSIIDSKPVVEKMKNQISHELYSSYDESDSSSEIHSASNIVQASTTNKMKTNNLNMNTKNESLYKKTMDQRKQVNEESSFQFSQFSVNSNKVSPDLNTIEINKNEINNLILDESSSNDDVEYSSHKNDITNQNKLVKQEFSNNVQASSVLKSKEIPKTSLSNSLIKLCSKMSTSSSSEDDADISLSKLRNTNLATTKMVTPVAKQNNTKDTLIQQVINSVKHKKNKKEQKLFVSNVLSSSFEDDGKIEKNSKDKYAVKTKDKKSVSKKSKHSTTDRKISTSSANNSQKDSLLQLQIQSSTDDSTDDEIKMIKNIVEKNNLNTTSKSNISTLKNGIPANLSKLSIVKTNELIDNTTKKIRKLEQTKDLLINALISAEEFSSTLKSNTSTNSTKPSKTSQILHGESKSPNTLVLNKTKKLVHNLSPNKQEIKGLFSKNSSTLNSIKKGPIKLNDQNEPYDDLQKKYESSFLTLNDNMINDDIKTKNNRNKDTKNLLIDSIINKLENCTDESEKTSNSPKSLDKSNKELNNIKKTKKKCSNKTKNKLLKCIINDLEGSINTEHNPIQFNELNVISEDQKKQSKSSKESKVITDNLIGNSTKTKSKKPKVSEDSNNVINVINDLSKSSILTKNKKNKQDSSLITNDESINTILSKVFKKIHKKTQLDKSSDKNILTIKDHLNQNHLYTKSKNQSSLAINENNTENKKRKRDRSLSIEINDELKSIKNNVDTTLYGVSSRKKKKFKHDEANDLTKNDIKEKYDSSIESKQNNLTKKEANISTKEEKLDQYLSLIDKSLNITTNESSLVDLKKKKKKRKSDTVNTLNQLSIGSMKPNSTSKEENQHIKNKEEWSLSINPNDESKFTNLDSNVSEGLKKKKKKVKLDKSITCNNLPVEPKEQNSVVKIKNYPNKEDQCLSISPNDKSKNANLDFSVVEGLKKKKKKVKLDKSINLSVESKLQNLLAKEENAHIKKDKKSQRLSIDSNNELKITNADTSLSEGLHKRKKKKKTKPDEVVSYDDSTIEDYKKQYSNFIDSKLLALITKEENTFIDIPKKKKKVKK